MASGITAGRKSNRRHANGGQAGFEPFKPGSPGLLGPGPSLRINCSHATERGHDGLTVGRADACPTHKWKGREEGEGDMHQNAIARIMRIPKRAGEWRLVVVPTGAQRNRLRGLLPRLMAAERRLAAQYGVERVAHGFVAGRSPITNAWLHVGYDVTVSMDLAAWFDSIRQEQVAEALAAAGEDREIAEQICYGGRPAQGLPTSPAAANLAAVKMDREILDRLTQVSASARYTRYADDLTISLHTSERAVVCEVVALARQTAAEHGWTLRGDKTTIQWARAGRRIITGVAVDARGIGVPRAMRRRLRAALHRDMRSPECQGLLEWCRLRLPAAARPGRRYEGVPVLLSSGAQMAGSGAERTVAVACDSGGTGVTRRYQL